MNPNDLSIPELENLLARKDEYRNGMDFWDKLTQQEQDDINTFIDNYSLRDKFVKDRELFVLASLSNYYDPFSSMRHDGQIAFERERIRGKELYLKIVSDFNLFLGFQRYINYRLFLLLKEVK